MEALLSSFQKARVPEVQEIIYKDECVYSFDRPDTTTGLYINLNSFLAFGAAYAERYARKTGNNVFLQIRRKKIAKTNTKMSIKVDDNQMKSKITRLTIGLESGNNEDTEKYQYVDNYNIVVFLDDKIIIPYPNKKLPVNVSAAAEAILAAGPSLVKNDKHYVLGPWDGEARKISKHADKLVQHKNGKKIPPNGWKCERCDLTTNLWLNLTDGSILCGRKFFDGTGGNDHALEHYKEHGYPLAVKLGTIGADKKPDVFSYLEDEMVIDPILEVHLAHFGIQMSAMERSEKTLIELELELNQRATSGEWKVLTEHDSELQPMTGAGYIGLRNLGNSCYMNSVMQVLFTVTDFIKEYVKDHGEKYFAPFPPEPADDFNIQMAKLGNGLWSDKYANVNGIAPSMFKLVVGRDHPDFSTKQQQDAHDFFLHIISLLERESFNKNNPSDAFSFLVEERIECMASEMVKYNYREEYCLPLMIPVEAAVNTREDCKDAVLATDREAECFIVPFEACVDRFLAPELIEHFQSSAIGNEKTTAKKTTRLSTMPDYLMIQLLKFTMAKDWTPKKLNVAIDMPDELDITDWRAYGLQADEDPLPETEPADEARDANAFFFDESILRDLLAMGFTREASKRAIFNTNNDGVEAATNWLVDHFSDSDINAPLVLPGMRREQQLIQRLGYRAHKEHMQQLLAMGFDPRLARKALRKTDDDVELAALWLMAHGSGPLDADEAFPDADEPKHYRDGVGRYELVAFISHMGKTAQVGHYVCHILKNGQWVIFNDEKVALSQSPPKSHGYLYLYKRAE